ncbi:MAG: DUF4942 domain-containing protein [Endozoicomonadaceae bacterium]|nr:DUF4942 domain-containing protein [Endozoicomonadaceae bacterium]
MQLALNINNEEANPTPKRRSTLSIVNELKAKGQDHEYYPTTPLMIDCIKDDIANSFSQYDSSKEFSILDAGAGTGSMLTHLNKEFGGKMYAIEKSEVLIKEMPKEIIVIGSDFDQQQLLDKKVSVITSNPPYSCFSFWACKLIKEAYANVAYLVIPSRWKNDSQIDSALKARQAKASVIGSFRFDGDDSERKARGEVDIVRVSLASKTHRGSFSKQYVDSKVDPFALWVEENFKFAPKNDEEHAASTEQTLKARMKAEAESSNAVIESKGLIERLETFYNVDMDKLIANYQQISSFDPLIAKEFGISLQGVTAGLKIKIANLKRLYWAELFDSLHKITSRLCASSRKKMLEELTENVFVDFTASNAHSVLIWVMKKANTYFDEQLVDTFEKLICDSSIVNYKSNKKMFFDEGWSYNIHAARAKVHHVSLSLEHRIVADGAGGRSDSTYRSDAENGLTCNGINYINDLLVIANNMGFDTTQTVRADKTETQWDGKKKVFHYRDINTGKDVVLFEVKAFYNKNLHFKFKPELVCKMNVLFGKLKGWVKSHQEAAEEMDIDENLAKEYFGSQFHLSLSNTTNLLSVVH